MHGNLLWKCRIFLLLWSKVNLEGMCTKPLEPGKRKLAVDLYNKKEYPINEICKMMGISKPTLYEYVKEANQPNP